MTDNERALYFPNLNGLRFIAALLVLVTHLELFKEMFGLPNIWGNPVVLSMGSMGVDLFFVLSGLLITYLLLIEKKRNATISIGRFYLRRILRIWPLYFLLIAVTFFVVPYTNLPLAKNVVGDSLLFYAAMLPNLALAIHPVVHYASISWSIGVEEQFYIIWPLLIKKFKRVQGPVELMIILFMGVKVAVHFLNPAIGHIVPWLKDFVVMTRIECMGIGAWGACLMYRRRAHVFYNRFLEIAAALSIFPATLLLEFIGMDDLKHWVYSGCFVIILLNAAGNPKTIFQLEHPALKYLGKISYGIYMYQYFAIVFAMLLLKGIDNMVLYNLLYYPLAITIVVIIASVSYRYFEQPFLKLKPEPLKDPLPEEEETEYLVMPKQGQ